MISCKILSKNNTFFNPDASQSVTMPTAIFTDDAEERRARHAFCALDFQHTNVPLMNAATPDVDFMPKSERNRASDISRPERAASRSEGVSTHTTHELSFFLLIPKSRHFEAGCKQGINAQRHRVAPRNARKRNRAREKSGVFARRGRFCPPRAFLPAAGVLPAAGIFARRGHFCPPLAFLPVAGIFFCPR